VSNTQNVLGIVCVFLASGCSDGPNRGVLPGGPIIPDEPVIESDLQLRPVDLPPNTTSLRLAVTPYLGPELIDASWKPIARYLGEKLGIPVLLVSAQSYQQLIDLVADKQIDVASLSPLSYVLAKQRSPGLQVVAQELAYGATSFSSYVMVRTDDPARSIYDVVGRRIALVDQRSTSGFLFPYGTFLDHGIDPETDFQQVVYSGSHMESIKLLNSGRVDVTALGSGMMRSAVQSNPDDPLLVAANTRILLKAGRIPFDPICVREDFPKSGVAKIQSAFLQLNTRTQDGRRVLSSSPKISGWVSASDAQYDSVRRVLQRVTAHRQSKRKTKKDPAP